MAVTSVAMRTLLELMKQPVASGTRLGDAWTIIESALMLREFTENEEHLAALEQLHRDSPPPGRAEKNRR